MKHIYTLLLWLSVSLVGINANAQEFETLFPYPQAPDTCTTLESRCNYSTRHFWDKCDVSKPFGASSDSLLLKAMSDYLSIMGQANVNVGLTSVGSLMFKAQANKANFMKLLSCAELLLYYMQAPVVDDVYLAFLKAAVDASWMQKEAKRHYRGQMAAIEASKLGATVTDFEVTTAAGTRHISQLPLDSAEIVLLFFTNDETSSSIAATRLSADLGVNDLLKQGYTKVINIYTGKNVKKFLATASMYPDWTLVAAPNVYEKIDVRKLPSFYVLDKGLKVMNKNLTIDEIKNAFNTNS